MQLTDKDGNVFGIGGLEITTSDGKPKIPVINTDITIGVTSIVSGTVGRILFEGAGNVVQESANLFWDNTDARLDVIGSLSLLNLIGTNRSTNIRASNSSDNFPTITFYPSSGTNVGQNFQIIPRGTGLSANVKAQLVVSGTDLIADGTNFEAAVVRATGNSFTFATGKGGTGTIRPILLSSGFLDTVTNANQFWLYNTGNIGINTTTDAGFRLDVNGTARVTSLRTADIFPASTSISLWTNSLNASSRFYTAPVHQDGRINFNAIAGGSDQVLIRAWHTGSFGLGTGSSAAGGALTVRGDSLLIGTSGSLFIMAGTFGPNNVPYRLGISTNATTTSFYTGVANNLTNIESSRFEYTAVSHTFFTGTTAGNQSNPNQYTPLFLSNLGNVGIGTSTLGTATKFTIGGSQTASSAIARGDLLNTTLVAAANNDVLVGLDISPTYTNGAFTGLTNVDLRTKNAGFVIGSGYGYGALYGYANDGIVQVVDGGTSSLSGGTYASQIWLRPAGNSGGLNSNYWATLEQSTGGLFIQSGRYNSNIVIKTGRAGTSGNIYFNNAGGTMAMFFGATANLGIGTTTDTGYKLNVNGTGYFNGNLRVNGAITASSPTPNTYVCNIGLAADQSIASGLDAQIDFIDIDDTNNWYDPTTKRFTPTIAGYYHVDFTVWFDPATVTTAQYNVQIRKNASTVLIIQQPTINNGTGQSLAASKLIYFNGTTDYIDFTAYQSTGVNRTLQTGASSSGTYASIFLLAI
jgi:hypothetical protein